jgi:hypothetical protein
MLSLGRIYPSLTLGGYDSSRSAANDIKFKFNADAEAPYMVDISHIRLQGAINGTIRGVDLHPSKMQDKGSQFETPTRAIIDSNLPYMHLPQVVCDQIAWAFKLPYNESTNRYIGPDDVDRALAKSGAAMIISLTSLTDRTQTVNIALPHPSLNLYNGYPFGNSLRYFPMRPAVYCDKYSLGRAFLQEVYMIADYDRREFSLSQVDWATNLVALSPPNAKTKVAIAAIVGGAIGGCLILAAFLYFLYLKAKVQIFFRKDKDDTTDARLSEPNDSRHTPASLAHEVDGNGLPLLAEMDGKIFTELPAGYFKDVELDGANERLVFEMEDSMVNLDLLSKSNSSPGSSTGANANASPSTSANRNTNTPLSCSSSGVHDRLNGREVPPASPIPQTPLEFYSDQIRRSGRREARLQATQQKLGHDRNRLAVPTIDTAEDHVSPSASPSEHEEKDRSLFQE